MRIFFHRLETIGFTSFTLLQSFVLVTFLSISLSGCLVSSNTTGTTNVSESIYLHLYEHGDFIEYTVLYNDGPINQLGSTQSGLIRVDWTNAPNITNPASGNIITGLMKETTSFFPTGGGIINVSTRYITQENGGNELGTLYVHAYESNGQRYWVDNQTTPFLGGETTSNSTLLNRAPYFKSPLETSSGGYTNRYNVYDNCILNICNRNLRNVEHIITYGDLTDITAQLDKFKTYQLGAFETIQTTTTTSSIANPVSFDLAGMCYKNENSIASNSLVIADSTYYVYPTIGIVRVSQYCTDQEDTQAFIEAEISNTNITYK